MPIVIKNTLVYIGIMFWMISCRKQSDANYPYNGTYELRTQITIGGLIKYPRGNGNTIIFNKDQVTRKFSGTAVSRSEFTLHREIIPYLEPTRLMDKVTTNDLEFFIERSGDTLFVYPVFWSSDAGGSTYIKIR